MMEEPKETSVRNIENETIGNVVARDYRTAEVFEKHGIDFCCGGNMPVAEACRQKGIKIEDLQGEIETALREPMDASDDYATWELSDLADYIVRTHHAYLKENTSAVAAYAEKIAQVHGPHHPEVIKISEIFEKIAVDMAVHLREEEELLFPAIRKAVAMKKEGAASAKDLEALKGTLATLTHEHDEIGTAIHEIRHLSGDYALPGDACNTFMVTYKKLKEFEDDLHKHVHLENNILFPKAAKL
jgi:regulator of cell morphogenesis and NO signaling